MKNGHQNDGHDDGVGVQDQNVITNVVIVDDAYDSFEMNEPSFDELADLWALIEHQDSAKSEVADALGYPPTQAADLDGKLIDELLADGEKYAGFGEIWLKSRIGSEHNDALDQVNTIAGLIKEREGTHLITMESDCDPDNVAQFGPQLVFMDWRLGRSGHHNAVQAAVDKATEILKECAAAGKGKPVIVLISSIDVTEDDANDFCRRSKILRGMYHTVNKTVLTDPLKFSLYMRLFETSLSSGRKIQSFMDRLHDSFDLMTETFLENIGGLTLADYSFVQSLSLQNDSQPLGDYLVWLFSTYMGQLLLTDALHEVSADLDAMQSEGNVPILTPPSAGFKDLYHRALFDTSVGPIGPHPSVGKDNIPSSLVGPLGLGDIFVHRSNGADAGDDESQNQRTDQTINPLPAPAVFMLISPQCDLEGRFENIDRKLMLIVGELIDFEHQISRNDATISELFIHKGSHFWIKWNLKSAETVVYHDFGSWISERGLQRVARLRLPSALEVQRAFAADFTRIGSRVAPPIYQPIDIELLQADEQHTQYNPIDKLNGGTGGFLMLTKDGQQCALTIETAERLRSIVAAALATMRDQSVQPAAARYMAARCEALDRALNDDAKWMAMLSPFDPPEVGKPQRLLDGWVRVSRGGPGLPPSDGKPVAVLLVD